LRSQRGEHAVAAVCVTGNHEVAWRVDDGQMHARFAGKEVPQRTLRHEDLPAGPADRILFLPGATDGQVFAADLAGEDS
jgi:hypothetical protein